MAQNPPLRQPCRFSQIGQNWIGCLGGFYALKTRISCKIELIYFLQRGTFFVTQYLKNMLLYSPESHFAVQIHDQKALAKTNTVNELSASLKLFVDQYWSSLSTNISELNPEIIIRKHKSKQDSTYKNIKEHLKTLTRDFHSGFASKECYNLPKSCQSRP